MSRRAMANGQRVRLWMHCPFRYPTMDGRIATTSDSLIVVWASRGLKCREVILAGREQREAQPPRAHWYDTDSGRNKALTRRLDISCETYGLVSLPHYHILSRFTTAPPPRATTSG